MSSSSFQFEDLISTWIEKLNQNQSFLRSEAAALATESLQDDETYFELPESNEMKQNILQNTKYITQLDPELLVAFIQQLKRLIEESTEPYQQMDYADIALIIMNIPDVDQRAIARETLDSICTAILKHLNTVHQLQADANQIAERYEIVNIIQPTLRHLCTLTQTIANVDGDFFNQLLAIAMECFKVSYRIENARQLPYSGIDLVLALLEKQTSQLDIDDTKTQFVNITSTILDTMENLYEISTTPKRIFEVDSRNAQSLVVLLLRIIQASSTSCFAIRFVCIAEIKCKIAPVTTESERAVMWRNIFRNLVEDLLTLLHLPNFPAVEPLLRYISHTLVITIAEITNKAKSHSISKDEQNLLTFAVHLAGFIFDAVTIDKKWFLNTDLYIYNPTAPIEQDLTKCGLCTEPVQSNAATVVHCTTCNRIFHASCIGDRFQQFRCEDCLIAHQLAHTPHFTAYEFPQDCSKLSKLRQLYLNHLAQQAVVFMDNNRYQRMFEFCIKSWIEDDASVHYKNQNFDALVWQDLKEQFANHALRPLDPATIKTIARFINVESYVRIEVNRKNGSLLEWLCVATSTSGSSSKSSAVKAITGAVDRDSNLMNNEMVQMIVEKSLDDTSARVRESAVELVGQHAVTDRSIAERYQQTLFRLLQDPGLSVRKRVVVVFTDLLQRFPDLQSRTQIYSLLLDRANNPNEEETFKTTVKELFRTKFASQPAPDIEDTRTRTRSSVMQEAAYQSKTFDPSQMLLKRRQSSTTLMRNKRKKLNIEMNFELASVHAQDLIHLVQHVQDPRWVITLLRDIEDETQDFAELIADALMSQLIDENAPVVRHTENGQMVEDTHDDRTLHILETLAVISETNPNYLAKHLENLATYLQPGILVKDSSYHVITMSLLLRTLAHSIRSHGGNAPPSKVTLEKIASRCVNFIHADRPPVVEGAIECLGAVAPFLDQNPIHALVNKFAAYLAMQMTSESLQFDEKTSNNIQRAALGCGMLCAYLDENGQKSRCFHVILPFTRAPDVSIQARSVKGLFALCESDPNLLVTPESNELMTHILDDPSVSFEVVFAFLTAIRLMIAHDDERNERQIQENGSDNIREAIMGDQSLESSTITGVVQNYADKLISFTYSPNEEVRSEAAYLMESVLRHGLVNPIRCIGAFVMLLADSDVGVVQLAREALEYIDQKIPQSVANAAAHEIMNAYEYHQHTESRDTCEYSRLYSSILSKKDTTRKLFMASALRLLNIEDETDGGTSLGKFAFLARTLAHLPFSRNEEIVEIVTHANRVASLHAEPIGDFLKANLKEEDEVSTIDKEVLLKIHCKCFDAEIILLLIDLKGFLEKKFRVPADLSTEGAATTSTSGTTPGRSRKSSSSVAIRVEGISFKLPDVERLHVYENRHTPSTTTIAPYLMTMRRLAEASEKDMDCTQGTPSTPPQDLE